MAERATVPLEIFALADLAYEKHLKMDSSAEMREVILVGKSYIVLRREHADFILARALESYRTKEGAP